MEKIKVELPKRVVNNKKMEEELNTLQTLLSKANNAYKELKQMGDFSSQMPDLSTLSYSFAEAITTKAMKAIECNEAMTFEEKKEATARWRQLQDKANSYISAISLAKEAMPLQEENGSLVCPTISETAKEKSSIEISVEANTHYSLLMAAMQAIEKLREYEKAKNLPSLILHDLSSITSPENFAKEWAFGVFAPTDEITKRAREKFGYKRPNNKF